MTKAAIVIGVGASDGTGGAACRRFAREGLHVYAAGRTQEKLDAVAAEVRETGGLCTGVATDATDSAQIEALFDRVTQEHGAPELVLYNAGRQGFRGIAEMDDAFFEEIWRITCFGGFVTAREAAKRMVPEGRGTLLFTGATASVKARPPFVAFASAKHALRAVAHGVARELGPQGIHVAHVIIDGAINGDMLRSLLPAHLEKLGDEGSLSPDAIADMYWMLHTQDRSAWTLELDLRPYKESF
jgi:NAD(P)-dependent dehydrogenase (short-subunit alcohol dehydrogenase family)